MPAPPAASVASCPHHEAVEIRLDHVEAEIKDHTKQLADLRSLLIKAVVIVALAAGGGSTLAPTLLKLLGG